MNENLTNEEYLTTISSLGSDLKNNIIYEISKEPEKFIPLEEAVKSEENTTNFGLGVLAKILNNNGIFTAIEKQSSNDNLSSAMNQLILSGEIFRKVISISYNYDEKKSKEIYVHEDKKENWINSKKDLYSKLLNIPKENIDIFNIRFGSLNSKMSIKGPPQPPDILDKINKDKEVQSSEWNCLVEACKISPDMFDPEYDNYENWGINQRRGPKGPPDYTKPYDPPLGWYGYALKVKGKYDNGDDDWLGMDNSAGEWYIAYHGTGGNEIPKKILEGGFKAGSGQVHSEYSNVNPLNNGTIKLKPGEKVYKQCGIGVYVTPKISIAKSYSSGIDINGKFFHLAFMCRVNPYKIRISSDINDYWIVSGDDIYAKNAKNYTDEIRPYRILIKKN